jgi:hypothetical protein
MLERYLDNLTTYAESVIADTILTTSPAPSIGRKTPPLPMEINEMSSENDGKAEDNKDQEPKAKENSMNSKIESPNEPNDSKEILAERKNGSVLETRWYQEWQEREKRKLKNPSYTPAPAAVVTPTLPPSQQEQTLKRSASHLDGLLELLPETHGSAPGTIHLLLTPLLIKLTTCSPPNFTLLTTTHSDWEAQVAVTAHRLSYERNKRFAESDEMLSRELLDGTITLSEQIKLKTDFKELEADNFEFEALAEWESYLEQVFEPCYTRSVEYVDILIGLVEDAKALCTSAVTGTQALSMDASPEAGTMVAITDVLETLWKIFKAEHDQKREIHKLVAERDRRYKNNITAGLYRRGQHSEMRLVTDTMDNQERQTETQNCKELYLDIKNLSKVVGYHCFRGKKDNLRSAEELTQAAARIAGGPITPDNGNDIHDVFQRTQSVLRDLNDQSRRLDAVFLHADEALNDNEYAYEVARRKRDNTPAAELRELSNEKHKHDVKIQEDANSRSEATKKELTDKLAELDEMLQKLGAPTDGNESKASEADPKLRE